MVLQNLNPAGIYFLKANNKTETCSNSRIETPEQGVKCKYAFGKHN